MWETFGREGLALSVDVPILTFSSLRSLTSSPGWRIMIEAVSFIFTWKTDTARNVRKKELRQKSFVL